MKPTYRYLLAGLFLACAPLTADENFDPSDYGSQSITAPQDEADKGPFNVALSYDYIGKANFDRHSLHHQHISYSEALAEFDFVFYYDKPCGEGLMTSLSYSQTRINWHENPSTHQEKFDTLSLSLAGFSTRLDDWFWQARLWANVDANHMNFSEYLTWDMLLWGRYSWCDDIGLNIGFFAWTGMKIDRVWPVLGVDWWLTKRWKINLVFPVNISAVYTINDNWTFSIAERTFESRFRTGSHQPLEKALLHYQNWGGELALNYKYSSWLTADVHVGETFGGRLRISNQHNKHPHHYKFKSAPYAGGQIVVNF